MVTPGHGSSVPGLQDKIKYSVKGSSLTEHKLLCSDTVVIQDQGDQSHLKCVLP